MPKTTIVKLENSVNPDEVAHYEPPHLGLHSLPLVLKLSMWNSFDELHSIVHNYVLCSLSFWQNSIVAYQCI